VPAARRADSGDEVPPATKSSRRWTLLWLCALAAIAGAAGHEIWTLEHQPRWAPLALHATASERDLLLTWDAAAPAIQQASQGMMTVTDGAAQNQIPLTAAQLRSGKFNYAPSHDEVLFRLLVYDASMRPAGDSLHVARLHPLERARRYPPPRRRWRLPPPPIRLAECSHVARHEVPYFADWARSALVPGAGAHQRRGRVTEAASRKADKATDVYLAAGAVKATRGLYACTFSASPRVREGVRIVFARLQLSQLAPPTGRRAASIT
jgi:hypothetical protein